MKSKELMIGDWASYDGECVKIEGITTDSGRYKYPFSVEYIDGRDFAHIAVLDVDPIPLTEEMLEKNGLEKYPWNYPAVQFVFFDEEALIYYGSGIFYYKENTNIKIKYVHEFQHLLRLCGLTDLADNFKI